MERWRVHEGTRGSQTSAGSGASHILPLRLVVLQGLDMRWISFDEETYSALRSLHPREKVFEFPARSPVQYALESDNPIVAVLAAGANDAAVVTFRKRVLLPEPAMFENTGTRAGGILGLRDEASFQEEETREKRNWWRRFWDY